MSNFYNYVFAIVLVGGIFFLALRSSTTGLLIVTLFFFIGLGIVWAIHLQRVKIVLKHDRIIVGKRSVLFEPTEAGIYTNTAVRSTSGLQKDHSSAVIPYFLCKEVHVVKSIEPGDKQKISDYFISPQHPIVKILLKESLPIRQLMGIGRKKMGEADVYYFSAKHATQIAQILRGRVND